MADTNVWQKIEIFQIFKSWGLRQKALYKNETLSSRAKEVLTKPSVVMSHQKTSSKVLAKRSSSHNMTQI